MVIREFSDPNPDGHTTSPLGSVVCRIDEGDWLWPIIAEIRHSSDLSLREDISKEASQDDHLPKLLSRLSNVICSMCVCLA